MNGVIHAQGCPSANGSAVIIINDSSGVLKELVEQKRVVEKYSLIFKGINDFQNANIELIYISSKEK